MVVSFKDIEEAFEFVSFGSMYEHRAYLCKQTGKLYFESELGDDMDPLPDDIEDQEKYIEIPHKNELGLGKRLVLDFVRQHLPNDMEEVKRIFSKQGAYSKFKHLVGQRGLLEQWYEFEAKALEQALREWCESNSIRVSG